jgi:hypothetical protein
MGSKDSYLELKVLDAVLGAGFSPPATVYFALFSVVPTETTSGTELTSGTAPGYARLSVTNNTTNFPNATTNGTSGKGEKTVGVAQTFAANSDTVNWPTVVGWALYDTSSGGSNRLLWGEVAPLAITPAAAFVIPAGAVIWRED